MSFATFRFFYGVIHGMVFLIFFYLVLVFFVRFFKKLFLSQSHITNSKLTELI
jgi:hypothetical protein